MLLTILVALLTWLFTLYLPWWTLALPCLILGSWLGKSGSGSFLYGFLGVGMLWLIQTSVIHVANDGILTARIAELFSLPASFLVPAIAVFVGGMAGGLSTMTGFYSRTLFDKKSTIS